MLTKHLLALAILASIGCLSLAHAAGYTPVAQQPNLLPPAEPAQPTAAPADTRWYVAPYGTFIKTDSDRHTSNDWGGGLAVGKMIDKHFNVEVKGFYESADYNDLSNNNNWVNPVRDRIDGTFSVAGATADVQYFFMRDKLSPYAVLGLGGADSTLSVKTTGPLGERMRDRSAVAFIGELGAGLTYEVTNNVLVRSDVRYRYSNQDFNNTNFQNGSKDFSDMTVNVGVVIPFGSKAR